MDKILNKEAAEQIVETSAKAPIVEFTKLATVPFVMLIITDRHGAVLGVISGESLPLARLLSDTLDRPNSPVKKVEDTFTPLGQDTYVVTRDFVLGLRSVIWHWEGAVELQKILPLECVCTFVVNI